MHSSPRRRQISKRDELQYDPFVSALPCVNHTGPVESDILKQSLLHQLNARIGEMPDSPFRGSGTSCSSSKPEDTSGRFADLHRNLFSGMRAISSPVQPATRPQQRPKGHAERRSARSSPANSRIQRPAVRLASTGVPRAEKREALEDKVDSPAKRRRIAPSAQAQQSSCPPVRPAGPELRSVRHEDALEEPALNKTHAHQSGHREQKRLDARKQAMQVRKTSKMRSPGKVPARPGWK